MSIAMTVEEREQFLAGVHVGIFSIPDGERGPLSCPVWYQYDPGGDVIVITPTDSRKGRLLRPGLRVSFVAQQEENLPKYVSVEGPVVSIEPARIEQDLKPLASRYLGEAIAGPYIDATRGGDDARQEVVVRIRPERWLSADFAKRLAQQSQP